MVATRSRKSMVPEPPPQEATPVIHGEQAVEHWLHHYWQKLHLPLAELRHVALSQDRQEYMRWTGKRLNVLILGCYCYLPAHLSRESRFHAPRHQHDTPWNHRHLIFIEPTMQPQSIEVTVAHELIHLADRVHGTPRRHRHHGYDSIAADEAAITGYSLEELRHLLHEESMQRERLRREQRPFRYLYQCPNCGKQYPRARRYSHAVSCSSCDKSYNPLFKLSLQG